MAQKYRPKSLLDKTLQTSIPGKSLNDRWEAEHGYRPFDESASYQYENPRGRERTKAGRWYDRARSGEGGSRVGEGQGRHRNQLSPARGHAIRRAGPRRIVRRVQGRPVHREDSQGGRSRSGGLPISQDPEKMLKFHKAAQDQLKIEYGDRPIPDGQSPSGRSSLQTWHLRWASAAKSARPSTT
jgi:hypothetical protein